MLESNLHLPDKAVIKTLHEKMTRPEAAKLNVSCLIDLRSADLNLIASSDIDRSSSSVLGGRCRSCYLMSACRHCVQILESTNEIGEVSRKPF